MTTTKHTPGPWAVKTETMEGARAVLDEVERMLWAGGANNFTITTVVAPDSLPSPAPEWSDGTVCVAYLGNGPTGPTNAHLIAAAPDLLEVIRETLEWITTSVPPGTDGLTSIVHEIEGAIAKAEGRS